jgi:hypothetical protein
MGNVASTLETACFKMIVVTVCAVIWEVGTAALVSFLSGQQAPMILSLNGVKGSPQGRTIAGKTGVFVVANGKYDP